MRTIIVVAFMFTISFNSLAQSIVYVNDVLRVGVRAEPVSGAKKVSTVKTGEALVVLDSSNSRHYKVKTPAGRIGWVSRAYVSDKKPAFMRLEIVNREFDALKEQLQSEKELLQSAKDEFKSVETQFDQVQELNLSLEGDLSRLKEENTQLKSDIYVLQHSDIIPKKYQVVALLVIVSLLLSLGFFIGGQRVHNRLRDRLGGLDI
ncbi:MAG: TIGR04211 family SH3 domain-containing protein [Gammaproteobacteria bacterium]|nr:TIGR04211 family SH3 domain-containing protein [Gammaproteobacteria bacterium]